MASPSVLISVDGTPQKRIEIEVKVLENPARPMRPSQELVEKLGELKIASGEALTAVVSAYCISSPTDCMSLRLRNCFFVISHPLLFVSDPTPSDTSASAADIEMSYGEEKEEDLDVKELEQPDHKKKKPRAKA